MLKSHKFGVVACIAGYVVASPAFAQDDGSSGLQEIVVTAQKRSENLQNVGISVTAFSGEQLKQLGFTDATDIVKQTAGVNILSSHPSNTNISIRGISQNDFADHLETPVAVYFDEGYLGASGAISGQIYDLERVEVLRGPQGTLFGRNATGGLIHYVSKGPTETPDAYFELTAGENELVQFEGAIGGPISDRLRYRLSVAAVHDNGYTKNLIGPNPATRNNASVRMQLAYDVADNAELLLRFNFNANGKERGLQTSHRPAAPNADGTGVAIGANEFGTWPNIILGGLLAPTCAGCDLLGNKPPADPLAPRSYDSPGDFDRAVARGQAKLTVDLDSFSITSISDYFHLKKNFLDQDSDGTASNFLGFNTRENYDQFSQELRLNGESGGLSWVTGLYFLRMDGKYGSGISLNIAPYLGLPICGISPSAPACDPNDPLLLKTRADYTLDVTSYSAFAQGEYKWNDTLSTIVGVRYTHDKKVVDYTWTDNVGDPTFLYNTATDPRAGRTFENVSLKIQQNWTPRPGMLIYAGYSRGHKAGNWALPVFPPPVNAAKAASFPHKQEVLSSYEVGLKSEFLNRTLRFNASAFYYDYNNYQAFSFPNATQSITNKEARAYGGEVELTAVPMSGLQLSLGAASMFSKVYDIQLPAGRIVDTQLPFSSKFSWNALARYEWSALAGTMAAQVSATSVGAQYFSVVNEPITYEPRYTTADARVSYTTGDGHWSMAAWVKNFTNEKYRIYAADVSILGVGYSTYAPGRWAGVTLGYKM